MNPYRNLPRQSFWKASIQSPTALEVDFDWGRKFTLSAADSFATAGSCFAQHFASQLTARGGNVLIAEQRHPLVPDGSGHGYGIFSARYGNIYTVRQLLEMLEQAFGLRETVYEFTRRKDGRWVDMLRPRAVPVGLSSVDQARADRDYHLNAVRQMIKGMNVFVFTLGLTEAWINIAKNYCYPVVPGAVAGDFSPDNHRFKNFTFAEIVEDLRKVISIVNTQNPGVQILLTVSPVGLVATAEPRSVIVSTAASKSILRAAVDEVIKDHAAIDYFPSYEIITSPYGRGQFWAEGLRDVTEKGVDTVMEIFFHSRMPNLSQQLAPQATNPPSSIDEIERKLQKAITDECDEMFLDPALRSK
jgi:hypothetical protein